MQTGQFLTCSEKLQKNKKDRDRRQRTDDFSSVLSDSHGQPGYFVVFLILGAGRSTTSADLYSHSQKTFPISVI